MTVVSGLAGLLAEQQIPAHGIVHVGAHLGQEVAAYRACGFGRILLVEPNPALVAELRRTVEDPPTVVVVEGACASAPGEQTLHVTERSKLSSLYRPITRPVVGQVKVPVYRLADLLAAEPNSAINVAVVDVQGAELEVVSGAPLHRLDLVMLETHQRSKYAGAPGYAEAVASMQRLGWEPVAEFPHDPKGKCRDVAFMRASR